ncbi:coiled-coil domain-containing glutamate-rich protein 1 [Platichthys flesus]|uniref:coiled-coil domain-containing glutamate-rich protein 1 n=1 Tax=Platichthys flesus TaxID=8260 RepID=UPI002DB75E77|nr:coiled-coil domain-containing glutamate-rich protein 1 [Platichthys flesus]
MLSEMMCRRSCQQQQQQQQDAKEAPQRDAASRWKRGWSKSCMGRLQGRRTGGGGWSRGRNHHHPQRHHHHPRHLQTSVMSLRPVNVKGNRVRGMRAPKNTNQFLMHEKYQMLHLRSDSVGSDSASSSDSDTELTDMDSYLGILENARGALLDSPNPRGSTTTPPGQFLVLHKDSLRLQEEDNLRLQEDSMQYFPSEDDLKQSQNFMQRDFVEFCDILTS